jgi:hypothetical protein
VEFRAPSEAEQSYLDKVTERWIKSLDSEIKRTLPEDAQVNWANLLAQRYRKQAVTLSDLSLQGLSEEARRQLAFHLLLNSVNVSEVPLHELDLEKIHRFSVPEYLAPEKAALLLEIKILSGKAGGKTLTLQDEIEIARFLQQHPGLRWRFARIRNGKEGLLRYKRDAK